MALGHVRLIVMGESETREDLYASPRVGEFWRSLDPRDVQANRRVRVDRVEGDFAYVQSFLAGRLGRASRIHLSRFDGKQFEPMRSEGE